MVIISNIIKDTNICMLQVICMSNIAHRLSDHFGEKFIFEINGDQIKLSLIKMCFLHILAPDLLTDMEIKRY